MKENQQIYAEIGNRMRFARENGGISQLDMAQRIGCNKSHLSAVERGLNATNISFIIGYCNVLGVTPDQLLGYSHVDSKWEALLQSLTPEQRDKVYNLIVNIKNTIL